LSEIVEGSVSVFLSRLSELAPDPEALRIFLVFPILIGSEYYTKLLSEGGSRTSEILDKLHTPFAMSIGALEERKIRIFVNWLMNVDGDYLRSFVRAVKVCLASLPAIIKSRVKNSFSVQPAALASLRRVTRTKDSQSRAELKANLAALGILNGVNEARRNVIDYQEFYINELEELMNIKETYRTWFMSTQMLGQSADEFPFFNYSFMFNASAKTELLVVRISRQN
jgi:hypothetical protein